MSRRRGASWGNSEGDRAAVVGQALEEVLRAARRSRQIATEVFTGEVIYAIWAAAECGATVRELALTSGTGQEHIRRILGGV